MSRPRPVGARPSQFLRVAVAIAVSAVALSACGSTTSSSTATQTGSSSTAAAKQTPTVASVPASDLVQSGQLTFCSDFPSPPQEMYTTSGEPQGSDVDTGNAIAGLLGLRPVWVNTVFDTIIEALSAGKCDLTISGMFITPERAKQINFVPYLTSGEEFMVLKGNPSGIDPTNYATLCGKAISTELGAAETATAQAFSAKCKANGKAPITISVPTKTDVALEELITHHVQAFFEDSPVVGYYAHQSPSQFQLAPPALNNVLEGIGVAKNKPVPLAAVRTALKKLEADGAYATILAKWGLQSTKIPPVQ